MESKSLKTPDQYISCFTKKEKNKLNVVDLFAGRWSIAWLSALDSI